MQLGADNSSQSLTDGVAASSNREYRMRFTSKKNADDSIFYALTLRPVTEILLQEVECEASEPQ